MAENEAKLACGSTAHEGLLVFSLIDRGEVEAGSACIIAPGAKGKWVPVKVGDLQKFFAPLELSTREPPKYQRATEQVDGNIGLSLEASDAGTFTLKSIEPNSPFQPHIPLGSKIVQINKRKPEPRALNRIHGQCMILFVSSGKRIEEVEREQIVLPPEAQIVEAKVKGNLGMTLQMDPLQGCVVTRILDTSPFYYLVPLGSEILMINDQRPDVCAANVLKGDVKIAFKPRVQRKSAVGLPPPPKGRRKGPAPPPPAYAEVVALPAELKPKPKPPPKTWSNDTLKELFNAAKHGDVDSLKDFIDQGAPIDCTPFGSQTPLYIAAFYGKLDCLKFLINNGANFNMTEKDGFTPSHAAASEGHLECLRYLHGVGADLNFKTNGGQTCKKLAMRTKRADILLFLETIDKKQSIYEDVSLDPTQYWQQFNPENNFLEHENIREMVKDLLFHFQYELTQQTIDDRIAEFLMYLDVEGVGKVHNATFRDSFAAYVSMCWVVNPAVASKNVVAPPPMGRPSSTDELAMALQLSMESAEAEKKRKVVSDDGWGDFQGWDPEETKTALPSKPPDLNRDMSFTVGTYRFVENSYVREAAATASKVVRNIDKGDVVKITTVKPVDGRIRGELASGGYVTLFNITNGKKYVTKLEQPPSPVVQEPVVHKKQSAQSAGGMSSMEYQGLIQALYSTIDDKEREIARLKAELAKIDSDLQSTTQGLTKATQQLEDRTDCVICQDDKKDHVIIPCMHLCICGVCARESGIKECPLCMKPFTSIKRVYM